MERKTIKGFEFKGDGADLGFAAVFATFNVVDRDGDIVLPSAIEAGKEVVVPISHDWSTLPIGKGVLKVTDTEAMIEGAFFDTPRGREAYETLKQMGDTAQWSFGFAVNDSDWEERDGVEVRVLRDLEVFEVSPVIIGAGVNTRTLWMKMLTALADDVKDDLPEAATEPVSECTHQATEGEADPGDGLDGKPNGAAVGVMRARVELVELGG